MMVDICTCKSLRPLRRRGLTAKVAAYVVTSCRKREERRDGDLSIHHCSSKGSIHICEWD